jgi:hypothetical protein
MTLKLFSRTASRRPTLFLCGGLQSSGSTLVSWCFLQRADTNGVLDAENDLLPAIDPAIGSPRVWYKTTISCFRLRDLVDHYRDQDWDVRPLLVIRDLRQCWVSLQGKPYAYNGITAEDPPFRMRVRRFMEDWELFRSMGWPTLRYESLLEAPEATLRDACRQLQIDWDPAMLDWPKPQSQIADINNGNRNFWITRGKSLAEAIAQYQSHRGTRALPPADLTWLNGRFNEFNRANDYPEWEGSAADLAAPCAESIPSFESSRRYLWETRHKPLRWLYSLLGLRNRNLVQRRSVKVQRERTIPIPTTPARKAA